MTVPLAGPAAAVVAVLATLVLGALGALLRAVVVARAPRVGTHAVNVLGTGALAGAIVAADRGALAAWLALALAVGFAGAFTTFSGWMALVHDRAGAVGWRRAVVVDAALPTLVAVALTVTVFAGT